MDYNYAHERQENRSNPETGQGHPQNQHLLHYQHQQYPPAHHAIQAGYPGLRLAPYMNPLQGAGTPSGLVHSQEVGLVQPPRVPTSGSAASSRDSSQSSHEFDNVLSNVMQGSNVQGHYQQEPAPHSQHGMPLQQIPSLPSAQQPSPPLQQGQAHTGSGDAYHIEDLSHNTSHSRLATPTSGGPMNTTPGSIGGCANTTKSNSRVIASTGRTPKKRAAPGSSPKQLSKPPSMRAPMTQVVTPQAYQQVQILQQQQQHQPRPRECMSFSKHCQTEPLFQQVYNASMQFTKENDLPDGLEFTEDEKEKKISGVVATKDFEPGMEFGPFTGEFVKEGLGCFNPNTWEVCVRGKTWYYIDGATDPNNWMYQVRYARNTEEQNMEAYQFYGDIFFRTTKLIKMGTELRVFYGQDYCKHVGFKESLNNLLYFKDAERFECRDCDNRYTNSKSLFRHIKFEHDKENNLIPPDHVEVAKSTPPLKPKIPNLMTIKDVAAKMARDKERNAEKNKARQRPKVDKSKRFLKVKLVPLGKSSAEKYEKEEEFSCKRCRKKFPSEGHLKEHAAFHKEMRDVRPICEVCGLECKHNKALKQHLLSHNPHAYQCEFCKRYFRRRGCLVYHLRHIHQTFVGKKWTRGNAQEQMTRYVGPGEEDEEEEFHPELAKDMLESDPRSTHERHDKDQEQSQKLDPKEVKDQTQDKIFEQDDENKKTLPVCEICGEECKHNMALKQHLLSHDPTTYQCQYCDWFFKRKGCLIFHLRTKHKISAGRKWLRGTIDELLERDNALEDDSEEARLEEELRKQKRLQRLANNPKGPRHRCKLCGKECEHTRALKQHVMSHDPKSFQCKFCKWYFKRKGCLVFHLRTKHQVSVGKKWSRLEKEDLMTRSKTDEEENDEDNDYFDPNESVAEEEDDEEKDYFDENESVVEEDDDEDDDYVDENNSVVEEKDDKDDDYFDGNDSVVEEEDDEDNDYFDPNESVVEEEESMEQSGTDGEDDDGVGDRGQVLPKEPKRADTKKGRSTSNKALICNICGLECEHGKALKQHLISHDPKSLQCSYCKRYFKRKGCLVFHLRTKHQVSIGKKWSRHEKEDLMTPSKIDEKGDDGDNDYFDPNERVVEKDESQEQSGTDGEDDEWVEDRGKELRKRRKRAVTKMSRNTSDKALICKICGLECEHSKSLKQHLISHDPNALQCSYCKWYFRRKSCLVFHLRTKHRVNVGKKWSRGNELVKNAVRAKAPKALEPKDLGDLQGGASTQLEDSSTTTILYSCKFCTKKFTKPDFLLKHEAIVHVNFRRYRCRVCRKAFSTKYALQSHSHIHVGEKRFECFICNRKFNSNSLLVRHLMHHDKPDNSDLVFAAMQPHVLSESGDPIDETVEAESAAPSTIDV
eukprot:XP_011668267.1 PREDICTED: uncharacterized protein LOC582550 [Strongylocentrotus purpuratus]